MSLCHTCLTLQISPGYIFLQSDEKGFHGQELFHLH